MAASGETIKNRLLLVGLVAQETSNQETSNNDKRPATAAFWIILHMTVSSNVVI